MSDQNPEKASGRASRLDGATAKQKNSPAAKKVPALKGGDAPLSQRPLLTDASPLDFGPSLVYLDHAMVHKLVQ